MQLDIGVCRTLEGVSCPFEGRTVPTLLDVVDTLGPQLGPPWSSRWATTIPRTSSPSASRIGQRAPGRRRQTDPLGRHEAVAAAVHRDEPGARRCGGAPSQLTIVDWEKLSHDHYSWFQGDGIHLVYDGAVAMATLLNASIKQALAPPDDLDHDVASRARGPAVLGAPRRQGRARAIQLARRVGSAAARNASARERAHHRRAAPCRGSSTLVPAGRGQPRRRERSGARRS